MEKYRIIEKIFKEFKCYSLWYNGQTVIFNYGQSKYSQRPYDHIY
jgi:hypothetical protein